MAVEAEPVSPLFPMTEAEFEAWCDEDTRAEFADGRVILMPPVSLLHFDIGDFLSKLLGLYLELRPAGRLLGPEIMVRLRPGLRRVPDLLYVAPEHTSRIHATYVEGGPDAVWEIISPDSEERDWRDKYPEYEAAGVPEYWIINPYLRTVYLYRRNPEGKYERIQEQDGCLRSESIPGFWLKPEWLWQEPLPKVFDCLRELGVLP
jgi:Uma2 family endonuclease